MLLLHGRSTASPAVPLYAVGDKVTNDVVTPIPLVVPNAEETEKLRLLTSHRVPCFVKFFPATVPMVESNFHQAFNTNRERYLEAIQKTYKKPALDSDDLADPAFRKWVSSQQKRLQPFPLTTNLAEIWAQGAVGEALEAELAKHLHDAMSHFIRVTPASWESHVGPPQWRVITTESKESSQGLDLIFRQTNTIYRTNLLLFAVAKKDLLGGFPREEQAYAKYLVTFLRENCFVDGELTRQARWQRTNALWSADNYQSGQLIARAGEPVDARVKAALEELRARLRLAEFVSNQSASLLIENPLWWSAALCGFGLVAFVMASLLKKSRPSLGLIPMNVPQDMVIAQRQGELMPVRFWRERALSAERRVLKLTQAIRLRVAPHLGRWLAHKMVQQLISNRRQLLAVQRQAEAEVEALELRLENLKLPFQERIRAYEQRIGELEKQLELKDQQHRELIQMTIASARRKLELEHAKVPAEWN